MDRPAAVGTPGTEGRSLREIARHAINNTRFYPEWGRARIMSMVDNRPDWTLSRQRNWGTPLPFFLDRETDEPHPDTARLIEAAAKMVERGVGGLVRGDLRRLQRGWSEVPQDHRHRRRLVRFGHDALHGAARLAGQKYPPTSTSRAATSTAAGSSRACSPAAPWTGARPTTRCSRMGSPSTARDARCPSRCRTRPPRAVSDRLGAEILRLWIAATDYSGEMAISEILAVVESYRRIRNTLQFLLAYRRLRSGEAPAAPGRVGARSPLRARDDARDGRGLRGRLREVRVPPRRAAPADLLLRGPGRLLARHPQGPPLYRRQGLARAALRAERAASRDAACCCASWRRSSRSPRRKRGSAPPGKDESVFFHTWTKSCRRRRARKSCARWERIRAIRALVTKQLEESRAAGAIGRRCRRK